VAATRADEPRVALHGAHMLQFGCVVFVLWLCMRSWLGQAGGWLLAAWLAGRASHMCKSEYRLTSKSEYRLTSKSALATQCTVKSELHQSLCCCRCRLSLKLRH
jgi:hypothetical protein